jgi:hypothetical protein
MQLADHPHAGYAQPGYPNPAAAQQGYPQPDGAQLGYPQQGGPQFGSPQPGYPQQGYQEAGMPQFGNPQAGQFPAGQSHPASQQAGFVQPVGPPLGVPQGGNPQASQLPVGQPYPIGHPGGFSQPPAPQPGSSLSPKKGPALTAGILALVLAAITGFISVEIVLWANHYTYPHSHGRPIEPRVGGGCEALVALLLLIGGVLLVSRKSIGLILLNIAGAIALLISLQILLGMFVPSAVFSWEPLLVRRALFSPWLGRLAAIPGAVVALALLIFANVRSTRLWVTATTLKPARRTGSRRIRTGDVSTARCIECARSCCRRTASGP